MARLRVPQVASPAKPKEVDWYAIERIIRSRANSNGQMDYLIKWKDRPESENSWESANDLYSKRKSAPFVAANDVMVMVVFFFFLHNFSCCSSFLFVLNSM